MTVAPLPSPRADRLSTTARVRQPPTKRSLVSRRRTVQWTKRVLPVLAMLLLASVALWPEISRQFDNARYTYRKGGLSADVQAGKLLNVQYHGQDARNRPYTVTAEAALQAGAGPDGSGAAKGRRSVSENGAWTYGESLRGVYHQRLGLLDMSGDVMLYRDDGVTVRTQSAAMDLKQGAAAGDEPTHAEGPFGTLDALGFALVDKGDVIQFSGKSRLVLNGTHH